MFLLPSHGSYICVQASHSDAFCLKTTYRRRLKERAEQAAPMTDETEAAWQAAELPDDPVALQEVIAQKVSRHGWWGSQHGGCSIVLQAFSVLCCCIWAREMD